MLALMQGRWEDRGSQTTVVCLKPGPSPSARQHTAAEAATSYTARSPHSTPTARP